MVQYERRLPGTTLPRTNIREDGSFDPVALDQNMKELEFRIESIGFRGNDPPEFTVKKGQVEIGGVIYGSMEILVDDVGNNFEGYVRFARKTGFDEYTHDDPTDLATWDLTDSIAPYEANVVLEPKHGGQIAAAIPWKAASDPQTLRWVIIPAHRYDIDWDARVVNHSLTFDTNGYPLVTIDMDEDGARAYVNLDIGDDSAGATPAAPSAGAHDGILNAQSGKIRFDGTGGQANKQTKMGRIAGYKIACENVQGAVNAIVFGPYFKRRGDSKTTKPVVSVVGVRSGNVVTFTLTIADPTLGVTAVAFRKQDSGGTISGSYVTTWDSTTGSAGVDESLIRVEAVTSDPGLTAFFMFEVAWTDEFGNTQYIRDQINVADLEQVSKSIQIGSSGFTPLDNTQTWQANGGLLTGTTPGVMAQLLKGIPVVPGTVLTGLSAIVYRATGADAIEVDFGSYTSLGGYTPIAVLIGSAGTPGFETISASFTESAADTATHDYELFVASTPDGGGGGAPSFRSAVLTYLAPSYSHTY